MFSGKDVPAVGVSVGIERVFAILEARLRAKAAAAGATVRATETQVLVASIGNGLQVKRMELASKLWAAGVKAEFGFKVCSFLFWLSGLGAVVCVRIVCMDGRGAGGRWGCLGGGVPHLFNTHGILSRETNPTTHNNIHIATHCPPKHSPTPRWATSSATRSRRASH